MSYRLFVDLEVISTLSALPPKTRKRLLHHLPILRSAPDRLSDYFEHDGIGRRVEISICSGYAIHYWIAYASQAVRNALRSLLPAKHGTGSSQGNTEPPHSFSRPSVF